MKQLLYSILMVMLFSLVGLVQGQVIWMEDFSTQPNGTQNTATWTTTANNCDADGVPGAVSGNFWGVSATTQEFRCNDIEGATCCGASQQGQSDNFWLSEIIDISPYANISISISARVTGAVECAVCTSGGDYFEASYRVDAGPWIPYSSICGAVSGFSTVDCIDISSGNDLELRVMVGNQANDENYYFDNVLVQGDACPPLPVTLSSFYVSCNENLIHATWTTESEINNDHFKVLGSVDGINYQEIVRVAGNGNTNSTITYNTSFTNPDYFKYFRLEQVDFNNSSQLFEPAFLSCAIQDEEEFSGYMVNGVLYLSHSSLSGPCQVQLHSTSGQCMLTKNINFLGTDTPVAISGLEGLSTGIYVVTCISQVNGNAYHCKLFIN